MNKEQVTLLLLQSMLTGADPRMAESDMQRYVDTALALAKTLNKTLKEDG